MSGKKKSPIKLPLAYPTVEKNNKKLKENERKQAKENTLKIIKVKIVNSSPFYTGNITCFLRQPKLHFTDDTSYAIIYATSPF
jgi:hypothetical protein